MSEEAEEETSVPSEPLFQIDLGANGGLLAPQTFEELKGILARERQFWAWFASSQAGDNGDPFVRAFNQLDALINRVSQTILDERHQQGNRVGALASIERGVYEVFGKAGLPFSTTTTAIKIENYQLAKGARAGSVYARVLLESKVISTPKSLEGWQGLFDGLAENYDAFEAADSQRESIDSAFEILRLKLERLATDKTVALDSLHRQLTQLNEEQMQKLDDYANEHAAAQLARTVAFDKLMEGQEKTLETTTKTLIEGLALKAPVEYWTAKAQRHRTLAWITGVASIGAMALVSAALLLSLHFVSAFGSASLMSDSKIAPAVVASGLAPASAPSATIERSTVAAFSSPSGFSGFDPTKVTTLVLIGIFGVWGIRLIVRMFLSNLHLMTDAQERAVMITTYLALGQTGDAVEKDHRTLILQTIFRPAPDGIVKDEGVPFGLAEIISRQSR